jgi:hypothetical protein
MHQHRAEFLLDLLRASDRAVAQRAGQIALAEAADIVDDAPPSRYRARIEEGPRPFPPRPPGARAHWEDQDDEPGAAAPSDGLTDGKLVQGPDRQQPRLRRRPFLKQRPRPGQQIHRPPLAANKVLYLNMLLS